MRPGHRIGNYVIIEQIGQGGQAAVWSADDEALKRLVAVKTISLTEGTEPGEISPDVQAERFRVEARLIADLEHPFILPIYSFGQEGDELYLIMRYMAGGTLKKLLQQKPLDLTRAIAIAKPLADALDVAHEKNIVHRDIKSVNVLMDGRQNAYLADFGLSVTAGTVDTSGVQSSGAGTLAYMSPEQMRSEPPEPRSDIYAFGILLFEMLTGNIPLVKNQPWNLQQMISGAPLPVPDTIPMPVATVLRRATAADPNDRYQSALEMVDDLSEAATARQPAASDDIIEFSDSDDMILFHDEEDEVVKPSGPLPVTDPAMLALIKANGMFETALNDWADGAGRFRLYAEDFAYIDSFYSASDSWGVDLDDAAKRMMLRAALEHGHNVEMWWSKVTDIADRRAVTLQTLTSELPSARLRAMQRLADIQDSTPPAIPIRVANIIKKETDAGVRLAGVKLLETRADRAANWRQTAYSEMIDSVLADLAANDPDPKVAEAAARVSARLYSTYAVTQLGQGAAQGNLKAREALVNARDEVRSFPSSVPGAIRRRVFLLLSIRQFFSPGLLARYIGGMVGFAIGWAIFSINTYLGGETLVSQAIGNGLASGALFGILMGLGILLATEPARRLRAWSPLGRIVLSIILGTLGVTAALYMVRRLYYFTDPGDIEWLWLVILSIAISAGFAIPSGLTGNSVIRGLGGIIGTLIGLWISWLAYLGGKALDPVIMFAIDDINQSLVYAATLAIPVGILTFLPEWLRLIRGVIRRIL